MMVILSSEYWQHEMLAVHVANTTQFTKMNMSFTSVYPIILVTWDESLLDISLGRFRISSNCDLFNDIILMRKQVKNLYSNSDWIPRAYNMNLHVELSSWFGGKGHFTHWSVLTDLYIWVNAMTFHLSPPERSWNHLRDANHLPPHKGHNLHQNRTQKS